MQLHTLMGRFHYNFWHGKNVDRVMELLSPDAEITIDTEGEVLHFRADEFVHDTLVIGDCLPKWTVVSGKYDPEDDYKMNAVIYIRMDLGVQYERVTTSFCIDPNPSPSPSPSPGLKFCCVHMTIVPIPEPFSAWEETEIASDVIPSPFKLTLHHV